MKNPYQPQPAKILKIQKESPDSNLYTLRLVDDRAQASFRFTAGQFVMAGPWGQGESAFDICSSTFEKNQFEICVRQVGRITRKIHQLKTGNKIYLRGPFGHGFPMGKLSTKNMLLIGGGCGFITMRTIIHDYIIQKPVGQKLQVFFGVSTEDDLLFSREFPEWEKHLDLQLIVSQPSAKWSGHTGLITDLFDRVKLIDNFAALLCGPPIMYRFSLEKLNKLGVPAEDIYLSFERRMDCGVGVCQHCAIGSYYVCKDGPVFSYDKIKDIPGAI